MKEVYLGIEDSVLEYLKDIPSNKEVKLVCYLDKNSYRKLIKRVNTIYYRNTEIDNVKSVDVTSYEVKIEPISTKFPLLLVVDENNENFESELSYIYNSISKC